MTFDVPQHIVEEVSLIVNVFHRSTCVLTKAIPEVSGLAILDKNTQECPAVARENALQHMQSLL